MRTLTSRDGVIDLFCGAGGLSWGWCQAGFKILAAVDNDPIATRTHELNFGGSHPLVLNRDLTLFTPADLARMLGGRPRQLIAVIGGPPCQGWSRVGRGKMRSLKGRSLNLLRDPRNKLYQRFLAYVEYFRPPICVMENVPGMLSIEGEDITEAVLENFSSVGYRTTVCLVNAGWFGVPQSRWRLIFIGVRRDIPVSIDAGHLNEFAGHFRNAMLSLPEATTLRQAIGDLPQLLQGTNEDPQPYVRSRGRPARYAAIMREGSNGMVSDHVCRGHNSQDLAAFRMMREGMLYHQLPGRLKRYRDDIFKDKYKRLVWDKPSGTVTAHFAKDVYTHIHPSQPRTISVREAARVQSFPDRFRFLGHMSDRFRQIGNAVPPLMAWGIAEFVRGHLESASA